jgi:hypothetical protein
MFRKMLVLRTPHSRLFLGFSLVTSLTVALAVGCGHSSPPAAAIPVETAAPVPESQVQSHDLNAAQSTEVMAPVAASGSKDYSGLVKIETLPEGIHIIINATDDDVDNGVLGSDVKKRDAVIVYPKGKGTKESVEVPLQKTATGYVGDKIVLFDQFDKLTDEGTKIDVAIFDHDKGGGDSEEMHLSVRVSTGKSCEKAQDENPQVMDMRGGASTPDLTEAQLGAPMQSGAFMGSCGLAQSAHADICVAVKKGKPLGVSVVVSPKNNQVATCIDRATRRLHFPSSEKLDVVKEKF